MVHLAMSETNEKGEATSWFEPVSDADYAKAPASSATAIPTRVRQKG